MTVALVRAGDPRQIPGVWLLLYGVAVMQAGAFSVRTIPVMGAVFVVAGAIALPLPWFWANVMLAVVSEWYTSSSADISQADTADETRRLRNHAY